MSWSDRFRLAMARDDASPSFLVEGVLFGSTIGSRLIQWSDRPVDGYQEVILTDQCKLSNPSMSPPAFRPSASRLTLGLSPDVVWDGVARGQVIVMKVYWDGWDPADAEAVWAGAVTQVSRDQAGKLSLEAVALDGALSSRWLRPNGFELPLFHEVGFETTLVNAYVPGDTVLAVANSFPWQKPNNGRYGLLITPTTGEPFILSATTLDKGTDTFGGVSSDGVMENGAVLCDAGDTVIYIALEEQHPLTIWRRIVGSQTGTGATAGATSDDVYPPTWSLGLPSYVIDRDDSVAHAIMSEVYAAEPSGYFLSQAESVNYAGSWLASMLGDAGFFATMRMGRLTARAVLDPYDLGAETIGPDDMSGEEGHYPTYVAWAGSEPAYIAYAYDRSGRVSPADPVALDEVKSFWLGDTRMIDAGPAPLASLMHTFSGQPLPTVSATGTSVASTYRRLDWSAGQHVDGLPMRYSHQVRLPVFGDSTVRQNWRENVVRRIGRWACDMPELLELSLPGFKWAHLALGDGVAPLLPEWMLEGIPRRGPTDDVGRGAPGVVVAGGPAWFSDHVKITVAFLPQET